MLHMGPDMVAIIKFWGAVFIVGAAAFPLTRLFFGQWFDRGYLLSKALGILLVSYTVWFLGSMHLAQFTLPVIYGAIALVFAAGILANRKYGVYRKGNESDATRQELYRTVISEEIFFFCAFLFWSLVKGHEPSIHGLEKFMDYGFARTILNTTFLPPPDLWFAGGTINYYYFGHYVMAMLTRLSGLSLTYAFNLMLSMLFAFTFTMSYAIAVQLAVSGFRRSRENHQLGHAGWRITVIGILAAFLTSLSGNMQTLYAFTRGYTGEDVKPFWELFWSPGEFLSKLPEGLQTYWYANATRFIPFTIHEFPGYSFVVSDIHGHVLSLPFVLLALAMLVQIFAVRKNPFRLDSDTVPWQYGLLYGLLLAVLFMTNALDGPMYLGLFLFVFAAVNIRNLTKTGVWRSWGRQLLPLLAAGPLVWPFLTHFTSFVTGLAVNCPPAGLAEKKVGLFIFETVDKCQHSPLWMMWILWGFFIFTGILLFYPWVRGLWRDGRGVGKHDATAGNPTNPKVNAPAAVQHPVELLLLLFFTYSVLLIIFPEFFYFKDIYPAHFRSNTMFKLGYQAFIMFSIIAAYSIGKFMLFPDTDNKTAKRRFSPARIVIMLLIAPQLFLVSIYPFFSVRSYFDSLKTWHGINGFTWFKEQYPDDAAGITWLESQIGPRVAKATANGDCYIFQDGRFIPRQLCGAGLPVVAEADGDSYTDYARVSAYSGIPTVIGWPVHEWLWRGSYDVVAPLREDVRVIYEETDETKTMEAIRKHNVTHIFVGVLEREKFTALNEEKLNRIGKPVFSQGQTTVYEVSLE